MNKPIPLSMGFTQVSVKKSNFMWQINNFKYSDKKNGDLIESPFFSPDSNNEIKWFLRLYPNGNTNASSNYANHLSIYLVNSSSVDIDFEVEYTISIIGSKRLKCFEKSSKYRFRQNSSDGWPQFIQREFVINEHNNMLPNEVLTIFCEYTLIGKTVNYTLDSVQCAKYSVSTVLDAFEQKFETEEFSDVALIASCGRQLKAHRFVLAARSPVFSAMFSREMKEKTAGEISVPDVDYDSLKESLRFMYAGKLKNLDKVAGGVLIAAEKYQIEGLKIACEEFLFQNLSVANAIETLTYAYRFELDSVKIQAGKFISFHAKDVVETEGFKAVDEPKLMAEIVRFMSLD